MNAASPIRFEMPIDLREPVVILAYAGWNDGGEAATTAVGHLLETFSARKLATLEVEEFVDYTSVRPHARLAAGDTREIRWPDHEFFAISAETRSFDLVVGLGVEPQLRWRSFSSTRFVRCGQAVLPPRSRSRKTCSDACCSAC